jgi:hypothetical protein
MCLNIGFQQKNIKTHILMDTLSNENTEINILSNENTEINILSNENTEMVTNTHSQRAMVLQNKFDVEAVRANNEWHSCCLVLDRRAIQYFTQIAIICGIMIFTIYQLCTIESCESQSVYIGLLTMLIGVLVPSPKFSNKQVV